MNSIVKAEQELKRLRSLGDGKKYSITMTMEGEFSVGETTADQEWVDEINEAHDPKVSNREIKDWLQQEQA